MPTTRRRHAITETPPVQAALDELRSELGSDRVPLAELVIIGARAKLSALQSKRAQLVKDRQTLAELVRSGMPLVETEAATEVRRSGWARA